MNASWGSGDPIEGLRVPVAWLVLLLLVMVAASLRFYGISDDSLDMDETYQIRLVLVAENLEELIRYAARQAQPPLDYYLHYALLKSFPFSEFAVRLPAALFGTGLVAVVFLLTRWLFGASTGVLAGIAVACSASFVYFSQEARPYSIFFFFQALYLWTAILALSKNRVLPWILYGIVTVVMLYTRGMAPPATIAALNVSAILCWLLYLREKSGARIFSFGRIFGLGVITIVAFLLFVPSLQIVWEASGFYVSNTAESEWSLLEPLTHLISRTFRVNLGYLYPVTGFGFFIGAVEIARRWKIHTLAVLLLVFAIVQPIVAAYLYWMVVDVSIAYPRPAYFLQTVLPIFIIAAFGYVRLAALVLSRSRWRVCATVSLVLGVMIAAGPDLKAYYAQQKPDYRGVITWLKQNAEPGDFIIRDTFQDRGSWEASLYGLYVYYQENEVPNQYTWQEWMDYVEANPTTVNRLYMFIHEQPPEEGRFSDSNRFGELDVYGLALIWPRETDTDVFEATRQMALEALRFYPETSARVDVQVALARTYCGVDPAQVERWIDEASVYGVVLDAGTVCKVRTPEG